MTTRKQSKLTRAHTLPERLLLVKKPMGRFSNKITDRTLTADIIAQSGCTSGAATGHKTLFDPDLLSPMTTPYNQNRELDKKMTLPWSGGGWHAVTVPQYTEYKAKSGEKFEELMAEVRAFAANLPAHVEAQRGRLGTLFDIGDYPTREEFINCWHFKIQTGQIPSTDVRANLDAAERDDIAQQVAKENAQLFAGAWQQVTEKMAEGIRHVAKILGSDGAGGRKSPVNSTLIPNLKAQVEIAREMGAAVDDHELVALANEVELKLLQLSSEVLADNPIAKEQVAKDANHLALRAAREVQAVDARVQDLVNEFSDF
jgi:hypothetical protein